MWLLLFYLANQHQQLSVVFTTGMSKVQKVGECRRRSDVLHGSFLYFCQDIFLEFWHLSCVFQRFTWISPIPKRDSIWYIGRTTIFSGCLPFLKVWTWFDIVSGKNKYVYSSRWVEYVYDKDKSNHFSAIWSSQSHRWACGAGAAFVDPKEGFWI